MPLGTLLLIDDEHQLRTVVARLLELEGYTVLQAPDARRGLQTLQEHADEVLLILCDVKLPDAHGVELLPRFRTLAPLAEVVLMTAYGTVPDSVRAMKLGAFDYLTKGDSDDQLVVVVERAVDKARLQRRVAELERQIGAQHTFETILGQSAALAQAKNLARQVAPTEATVLLEGPTGSGKELFAQAIHRASGRAGKAFVAVNCSAFSRELLESELFGYRKGAFTGALADKKGLIEEASGGTLFLDEIGELELGLQAKLLRVLEGQEFIKIGDTKPTRVNVRLIAATNRNLRQEADQGQFRADLYYRLAVFTVAVPGLNARRDDIELLAQNFVHVFAAKLRKRIRGIEPEALRLLRQANWKGNVRELRNVLERAAILCEEYITPACLPLELQLGPDAAAAPGTPEDERSLRNAEKQHVRRILLEANGNKTEAARVLGVALTTLYRKIQDYGL